MPPAASERRENILQVAEDAFGESGFAGARIEDIAVRAGIRRPSLLHHFSDKQTLYAAVAIHILEDVAQRLIAATDAAGDTPLDRLTDGWIDFLLERPNAARFLLRHMIDPLPLPGIEEATARVLGELQEAIDLGFRLGANKRGDASELALVLASASLVWASSRTAVEGVLTDDTLAPEQIETQRDVLRQLMRQLLGASTRTEND